MNVISFIQDSAATGIETWLCYVFCSIFLDIGFFKKRRHQFALAAVVSVLIVEAGGFFFPFSLGGSMISSVLVFYLFSTAENMLLNIHNEMLLKSLEENRKSFGVWKSKVHDYKHHLIYMTELAESGDFDKLKDYLNREIGEIKKDTNIVQSGYIGIDSIINSKQMLAQSHHLHMFCNVNLPDNLVLDNASIASVLGNLLDNAITAGAEVSGSNVEVNIYMVKNNLCMKICNQTVSEHIDFTNTSASDRLLHGIGLKSVQNSVERMDGYQRFWGLSGVRQRVPLP